MAADPNSLVTPAILPEDLDVHRSDVPAEADDLEAGENNPTEDDTVDASEPAISQLSAGGTRDETDVRRMLNNYSPNAR